MTPEEERENFIEDLTKSLNDICAKATISEADKNRVLNAINEIRTIPFEDEVLMEETISEAYGLLNLISNKAMHYNLKLLNEQTKTQSISPRIKEKMSELEKTLLLVIEGIEKRDFELYQNNVQKIVVLGNELEKLAPQITSSIIIK